MSKPPRLGSTASAWLDELEVAAPNVVAALRGIEAGRFSAVRREVQWRPGEGSATGVAEQLERLAAELFDAPDGVRR